MLAMVEEPEIALHPHAATRLFAALMSAPHRPQLLMTTHSPFVIEASEVSADMLRVAEWRAGRTVAGAVDSSQLEEIRDHLATEAELMADGTLAIDEASATRTARSLRPSR